MRYADEILAIALIKNVFNGQECRVERTFSPEKEDFAAPEVLILDIGRRYEPELGNFDHHQTADLPATNMLCLRHYIKHDRLRELLELYLFKYVSEVDCGIILNGESIPSFNSLIRAMNNLPQEVGFERALEVAGILLSGQIAMAEARMKAEKIWETVSKMGKIAMHNSTEFIVGWHELAKESGILLLVTPNVRGGYQIITRSTEDLVIPTDARQSFRHNSGFMAVYASLEEAIAHARELTEA